MQRAINTLLVAAVALALTAGAANAAYWKHKPRLTRHHHPEVVQVSPAERYPSYYEPGPRPVWAPPGSCFTEEGYGRYWPCGAGPNMR
ncbi:MAG TPA: hypothetical protein VK438_15960 [Xanthobacteraceae bacterium]|nr:hypothetical protein [Xanthobacteraceae bacterium]